jgi:hypothetical protein
MITRKKIIRIDSTLPVVPVVVVEEDVASVTPTKTRKRRDGMISRSMTDRLRFSLTTICHGPRSMSCDATIFTTKLEDENNSSTDLICTKLQGILLNNNKNQNTTTTILRRKKHKNVRFMGGNHKIMKPTIHTVPPLFEYSDDLWWTREEINQCKASQANFSLASSDAKDAAKLYLKSIHNGPNQLAVGIGAKAIPSEITTFLSILPEDTYRNLVLGKAYGFSGLELYNTKSYDAKRQKSLGNIKLIAKTYHHDVYVQRQDCFEVSERIRQQAEALSAADRSWAYISAQADQDAVTKDDHDAKISKGDG